MGFVPVPLRTNGHDRAIPFGATRFVLVREGRVVAHPVPDDIPVLLAPEALGNPDLQGLSTSIRLRLLRPTLK